MVVQLSFQPLTTAVTERYETQVCRAFRRMMSPWRVRAGVSTLSIGKCHGNGTVGMLLFAAVSRSATVHIYTTSIS